jgi:putative methionine-R-sulfoxide reductase with GAF domain
MAPQPDKERPRRRDYEQVLAALETRWKRRTTDRLKIMQDIADGLWGTFGDKVISWCGFFLVTADGQASVLGPHRDVNTVSGEANLRERALAEKKTQFISADDVERNPALRAEIAVPVLDLHSGVFALLNIHAAQGAVFGEEDRRWLERMIRFLEQSPRP